MSISSSNQDKFCQLARNLLLQAEHLGAGAAEIRLEVSEGFNVKVRQQQPETLERNRGQQLEVTLYFGNHIGTASTSDFTPTALTQTLEKASYIARFTEEDPYLGLADPAQLAYDYPDLELYHPWTITPQQAVTLAQNCEQHSRAYDSRISDVEEVFVESNSNVTIYTNSQDFLGSIARTHHLLGCSLIAEQAGDMQRDSYYSIARDANHLEDFTTVASQAAQRTANRLGARRIAPQQCPIILQAELAAELFQSFASAITGGRLYRKSSFLVDTLQQPIFPKLVTIVEDPLLLGALGSTPFDHEGVRVVRSPIVSSGVLQRYLLNSYSARKLGMQTTGNAGGIHNWLIEPGTQNLSGLMQQMGSGLLVTELLGGNVDLVTGNYSRGAFGYWIEGGQIAYPVSGVTIAGNLKEIFTNIGGIGNDIDYRNQILSGSLLINQMMVAGDGR